MEVLNELLIRDKFSRPEIVAEVLKEEIMSVARNFFLMEKDIVVRYKRQDDKFVFNVEIVADRIKPFGNKF